MMVVRNASGDVVERTPFVQDRIHGTRFVSRWCGGEYETPYVDGKKHGTDVERKAEGGVARETPSVEGKENGLSRWRSDDGKRAREERYVEGNKDGLQFSHCWSDGNG